MSDTAVLVIDMFNAYRHSDAERLVPSVAEIIDPLVDLIGVARERDDVDLVYINDNYGDFTADHDDIVRSALDGERPDLVGPIVPTRAHCSWRRSGILLLPPPRWPICCASWRPNS